jgi:hypothetical protein
VNTRNFGGSKAMGEASNDINRPRCGAGFYNYEPTTLLTT